MKRGTVILIICVLLLAASFGWRITWGNAVWRVHRNYPAAQVDFSPQYSPDASWGDLVRLLGIRYYSSHEPISITLSDAAVNFDDFRGMLITKMCLTRCRVTDLRPILKLHPASSFTHCDLSALPPDQMSRLWELELYPGTFHLH